MCLISLQADMMRDDPLFLDGARHPVTMQGAWRQAEKASETNIGSAALASAFAFVPLCSDACSAILYSYLSCTLHPAAAATSPFALASSSSSPSPQSQLPHAATDTAPPTDAAPA
eukprot:gene7011-6659_t